MEITTVTLRDVSVSNVPTQIIILDEITIAFTIDGNLTNIYFGTTPIN